MRHSSKSRFGRLLGQVQQVIQVEAASRLGLIKKLANDRYGSQAGIGASSASWPGAQDLCKRGRRAIAKFKTQ